MTRRRSWGLAAALWLVILLLDVVLRPPTAALLVHAGTFLVTVSAQIWRERRICMVGLITRRRLEEAPSWTVFKGPAEDPGRIKWELFEPEPVEEHPQDVQMRMLRLGVWLEEPEIDAEWRHSKRWHWRWIWPPWRRPDDLDAALAYLRRGGTLCKVPDTMDSKYWRLLVIRRQST